MKPAAFLLSLLLITVTTLHAQVPPRAVPVEDGPPRAVPVEPAPPAAPRAQVVEDASKPKGPDDDLFDYANLAFGQKDYVIAGQSYGKYLQTYPNGQHVPDALYRLGECQRNLQRSDDAFRYYREVVDKHPKAAIAPNAAYWLGVIAYTAGDYKSGATYFGFCATHTDTPKVLQAATYYQSECYGLLKDRRKQLETLKPLLDQKKDNDYREKALLAAATIYQTNGENNKALPLLIELLDTAADPAVKGNAGLKAAIIQSELKKPAEASALYKRVLELSLAPTEQRGAALVGYVGELSASKDYDGVIDTYNRNASLLPPADLRPRLLMHVANAHRMKKAYTSAISVYDLILQYFPDHEIAFESEYWRIYCLYLMEDKRLVAAAQDYVKRYAGKNKDHEFINTARLLIADSEFTHQNYKAAAAAFQAVNIGKLQERFRASSMFHRGWSEAEAGQYTEAITSLTIFINEHPLDDDVPKALAKRGLCHKEAQNPNAALADFARIIKDFPKSEGVELALYLSGIIHSEQRDWKAVIAEFEAMIAQFPRSAGLADAHYKTGLAYVEQRDTPKALPHFRQAVALDEKSYGDIGTQKVLLCLWNQKDVEALSKEVDAYRAKYQNATLVPTMLGYLGITLFDRKDYLRSAKYLTWASTPEEPSNTDPRIWNYLGQALLEAKSYQESINATDHYLATANEGAGKARALLTKGNALLGLEKPEDALKCADEGLQIVKDGGLQGLLLIAQGDSLLAMGDRMETDGNHVGAREKWLAAAAKYVVPSQVLNDEYVTPLALSKAAAALERAGDRTKAQEMRDQLKKQYPAFKEP